MNHELLNYYYTDNQLASILGITLGGLRNKIYKETKNQKSPEGDAEKALVSNGEFLPECLILNSRSRLWPKENVREFLLREYQGNEELVAKLIAKGDQTSPSVKG